MFDQGVVPFIIVTDKIPKEPKDEHKNKQSGERGGGGVSSHVNNQENITNHIQSLVLDKFRFESYVNKTAFYM